MSQETGLVAMRFAQNDVEGVPDAGVGNGWAFTDPISVDLSFEYETGADITQKDGAGRLCFVRRRPDSLKSGTVSFEVCSATPDAMAVILGNQGVAIGSGTAIGFGLQNAACDSPIRTGTFCEWWAETWECNAPGTVTYVRHILPAMFANYDGGTWNEERHSYSFSGIANAGVINDGPFNDLSTQWPADTAFLYGFESEAVTDETLPTAGTKTVPSQS